MVLYKDSSRGHNMITTWVPMSSLDMVPLSKLFTVAHVDFQGFAVEA